MKVSNATTHVKYYASHQMMITKLQTFNDLKYTAGAEKSLRLLQLNMEKNDWFLGEIRIPRFNYNINFKTNQVVIFSEYMFGTQINPLTAREFKDTIYNSMVSNEQSWIYQEGIQFLRSNDEKLKIKAVKEKDYGFKDYTLENFIIRGTKPLGKDEPHWDIAYVDIEAFCGCTKDDRKKAFKFYEGEMM